MRGVEGGRSRKCIWEEEERPPASLRNRARAAHEDARPKSRRRTYSAVDLEERIASLKHSVNKAAVCHSRRVAGDLTMRRSML